MNENIEEKEEKKLTPELELLLKELGLSRKDWWSLYGAMKNTGRTVRTELPMMYALSLKKAIQTFNKGTQKTSWCMIILAIAMFIVAIAQIFVR